MYTCAVHIQVLQKPKTVCFTSCSKGTYVILPLSKSYDPGFLLKMFSTVPPLTLCWAVQWVTREGGGRPCLHGKKLLYGPFEEALDWSQGKPSRTVKQTDRNRRLFWCEEDSVTSAPQADGATGLTSGTYSCWRKVKFTTGTDTQFVHCLSGIWGAGWWRCKRAGR